MDILFQESKYLHIWNKWKLDDLPVLAIKSIKKNGEVLVQEESLLIATFQYINAVAVLAEAKLENLKATSILNGGLTPERRHFFLINENFFNSFDEAIDTAHNQVEVETDNYTQRIKD